MSASSLAAGVAGVLAGAALVYLVDPTGPQWRRSAADRERLAAILTNEPAREQWLAADLARLVARQRWQGIMASGLWFSAVAGTAVGLLVADGELWPLVFPTIFMIGAPISTLRHTCRCRTLRVALIEAGVRPS